MNVYQVNTITYLITYLKAPREKKVERGTGATGAER